jgi:serine/threonine protein kinase
MNSRSDDDLFDQARSTLILRQGDTYTLGSGVTGAGGASEAKESFTHLSGKIIDHKYKIGSLLGHGGMGAVYSADHILLNKSVALKTFRSSALTEQDVLRFQREAQALARLDHPNIVKLFDFGYSEEQLPYYTMELLNGKTLDETLSAADELSLKEILNLFIQVCSGLSLAHQKGIVHRDIKPSNIFLQQDGTTHRPKLVDFGIASLTEQLMSDQRLTTAGLIFGSPLYMSPEQSLGAPITPSSDIYSLGCALFETLTGAPPYHGNNAIATMLLHQTASVPKLNGPSSEAYPQSLELMVQKMLAKNPSKRQQSVEQLTGDIQYVLRNLDEPKKQANRGTQQHFPADEDIQDENARTNKSAIIIGCSILFIALGAFFVILKSNESKHSGETSVASNHRPFVPTSNTVTINGKKYAEVRWRKKIGDFFDSENNKSYDDGVTRWEIDGLTQLGLDPEFSDNPDFLAAIPEDSVQALIIHGSLNRQKSVVLLKNIQKNQHKLETLMIEGLNISDEDLSILRAIPSLHEIGISRSSVTGGAMAELVKEKRGKFVKFQEGHNIGALIAGLKGSTFIEDLQVSSPDSLRNQDYETIATLSGLKSLEINFTKPTDKNLLALSNLTHLCSLEVMNNALTPASAKTLAVMASHHPLTVSMDDDSLAKKLSQLKIKGLKVNTPGSFVEAGQEEFSDLSKWNR